MSKGIKGSLMVLVAGFSWGISGISGQYLMAQGIHVNLLTSLRLLISGLVLLAIVAVRQPRQLGAALARKDVWLRTLVFSLCGLVLNQFAYLQAIKHTNAGTATVLQYMAPVIILALVCLKKRTWPTLIELLSILFAILGTFIIATHGHLSGLAMTPTGLFWGLFSAFTYVAYILIPITLIQEWGSLLIIGLGMLIGGLVFPVATQAWRYDLQLDSWNNCLAYFGIIGVGTIFAYTVFLQGTAMIGAVKGSLLASIEPVASVLLTVLVLGGKF